MLHGTHEAKGCCYNSHATTGDGVPTSKCQSRFEDWKLQLRKDCEIKDKIIAFDAIGESVLTLLWRSGVAPSVSAIIGCAPEALTWGKGRFEIENPKIPFSVSE